MKRDIFDELIVVKRSGQRVNFNSYKIAIAIKSAYDNVYSDYNESEVNRVYEKVLDYIIHNFSDRKTINVEDIQDIIENTLKAEGKEDVYKAFSEYRQKRAESRKAFKIKQQHKFAKAMEKIADEDLIHSENNFTPDEILLKYGSTIMGEYSKAYLIDSKFMRAHEEGKIYIHDIDTFPLGKLSHTHLILENTLEKDPSIDNLIFNLLSAKTEINGEINISSIDYTLAPWVVDKYILYFKEFLHNYIHLLGFDEYINIKKVCYILEKKEDIEFDFEDLESVIQTEPVARMFKTAYTDAREKIKMLLGRKLQKIVDRLEMAKSDDPYYSISFGTNKSSAGKIINDAILNIIEENEPYKKMKFIFKLESIDDIHLSRISDIIASGKDIYIDFVSQENAGAEYFASGIKIFETTNEDHPYSQGRMVVGTTSINMARVAFESAKIGMNTFYKNLDATLELVKNELLLTFETIGNKNKENYRVIFNGNIANDEKLLPGQKIRKVLKSGTLNIGLIGLKECLYLIEPDEEKQYDLAIEILKHIDKMCEEYSRNTKLNFTLCEPSDPRPAKEFIAFDKAIYGIKKGITEAPKYDLISNLPAIKEDYNKLSKLEMLFKGGNLIEIIPPKNATPNKIKNTIEKIYKSNVQFVLFTKEGWYERCR